MELPELLGIDEQLGAGFDFGSSFFSTCSLELLLSLEQSVVVFETAPLLHSEPHSAVTSSFDKV